MFRLPSIAVVACALFGQAAIAAPKADPARAGESDFRATYRELVETDTSLSSGSCTLAAERMAARLSAAGYAEGDMQIIVSPDFPRQGNLVARIAGTDAKLAPMLLLAHIDVVEAKKSDWKRDPFTLFEENGYFYARGTVDDKAMAASFVDAFIRYKQEGYRPKRTIKLALTCGEETDSVFNGVQYLLATAPDTLAAEFAVNEGGSGVLDENGKPISFGVQIGEKYYQDFKFTVTAPGGHSARPVDDNAIGHLAAAVARIDRYRFPVNMTEASKGFFRRTSGLYSGQIAQDLAAAGNGTADEAAFARIAAANPLWNAFLRTTCVPTQLAGGHAPNAQPQHAQANINCRVMPGESIDGTRARLAEVAANARVEITLAAKPGPQPPAPPLDARIMKPVERIAAEMWPGVPVIPSLSSGATDGRFLNAAGIPTYGISGVFRDPDGNGAHGLDERIRVTSLLDARAFLYRLVKAYSAQ
ncbi:M20/M25/M40 family metallo-hydrolase [Sphingosinicella soli]|uniref:Acetylornithine deacetylase/succinyl-diaminopimelate desuccinylase-like protein n=1 Tax=Sphingosinicella soli TaxID=333708 RepID=A0A7W7F673_9SPHN|nr:M20/M25/M40 family metallo-hydrolase [Sphingosinicella soli]MBB4632061.1 acetylornithine deacetylase/succinyl-diaminopimelate desuccinylase-like protein [Sphingosinicella soli]